MASLPLHLSLSRPQLSHQILVYSLLILHLGREVLNLILERLQRLFRRHPSLLRCLHRRHQTLGLLLGLF